MSNEPEPTCKELADMLEQVIEENERLRERAKRPSLNIKSVKGLPPNTALMPITQVNELVRNAEYYAYIQGSQDTLKSVNDVELAIHKAATCSAILVASCSCGPSPE